VELDGHATTPGLLRRHECALVEMLLLPLNAAASHFLPTIQHSFFLPASHFLPTVQHFFFLSASNFLPVALPRSTAMAPKGGSESGGFVRPTNFTEAEKRVLWDKAILVPPAWHLSHGWNVSAAGYAVPPIPEGAELEALIGRRWQMLPMYERELPENAPRRGIWLPRLQRERQAELSEFAGPY
jgi:hypothetical protein